MKAINYKVFKDGIQTNEIFAETEAEAEAWLAKYTGKGTFGKPGTFTVDKNKNYKKPYADSRSDVYRQMDGELLEALFEKFVENKPEKLEAYKLKREDIKKKFPKD